MNKEFCNYTQALALKELGFDEPCLAIYNREKEFSTVGDLRCPYTYLNNTHPIHRTGNGVICVPLYQQAFSFFREKHKLIAYPQWRIDNTWDITIQQLDGYGLLSGQTTLSVIKKSTYEEAEQACLDKLIEIVKNGNK